VSESGQNLSFENSMSDHLKGFLVSNAIDLV